jgi:sigma-54 specific flagellar transcriptional regulator A
VRPEDLPGRFQQADWIQAALAEELEYAGQVREPAEMRERAELVAPSPVDALREDEPAAAAGAVALHAELPSDGLEMRDYLNAIERCLIDQALERSQGVVAHAARLLGLRRTTLVEKLRKFAIPVDDSEAALDR